MVNVIVYFFNNIELNKNKEICKNCYQIFIIQSLVVMLIILGNFVTFI